MVQAGQSEDGRKLAAASAEVIFTAHQSLASAQEFYRDIKARVKRAGRNPEHGTAYDIAGKGIADIGATREAILLAARMAKKKRALPAAA